MRLNRREALLTAVAGAALVPRLRGSAVAAPDPAGTTVQLLGTLAGADVRHTGGRTGSALLVRTGGALYLLDAGFGALLRLLQAGHEIKDLRHIAVTRHTVDHNADLGTALLLAWSSGRNAGGANDARRLGVTGPPGTERYVRVLRRQQSLTIHDQATALGQTPPFGTFAVARDVTGGVAYEDDRVRITALRTATPGAPAIALRVRTADRDVVLTGSSGSRTDLAAFAAGADTIVCEVLDAAGARAAGGSPRRGIHRLGRERLSPAAAAALAARAGAGRLVLAGVLPGTTPDDRFLALAGDAFPGALRVGHDLEVL